jgi:hypothetical protein
MSDDDEDERARSLVKKALAKKGKAEGTEDAPKESLEGEPMQLELDEVDLKDALRGALRPPPGAVAPSLLRGVQKKLRVRSRGKFYGDGWSTTDSPKTTYLITTLIMLVLVAILFLVLVPWAPSSLP